MSSVSKHMLQPGKVLHEVLVGALRARGTSFNDWCRANGVSTSSAKAASYGFSGGDRGRAIIDAMVASAGPEVVEVAYRQRVQAEAAAMARVA